MFLREIKEIQKRNVTGDGSTNKNLHIIWSAAFPGHKGMPTIKLILYLPRQWPPLHSHSFTHLSLQFILFISVTTS